MLASIRNVDYPSEKLHLCFALTDREDRASVGFLERAKRLIENSNFHNDITILKTNGSDEDVRRWGQYWAVIKNIHEARKLFLDGNFEYFWLLGGDNPPFRNTLKKLLEQSSDVACAIINQRPLRGGYKEVKLQKDGRYIEGKNTVYPVYWKYSVLPDEIRGRRDLDPRVREAILQAWLNLCYFEIAGESGEEGHILKGNVCCGSGCQLVKRKVLEYMGYYIGAGYHSEDIEFGQYAHLYGFDFTIDTDLQCRHFDPNGMIY